jgi:regulator of replication initiation timing
MTNVVQLPIKTSNEPIKNGAHTIEDKLDAIFEVMRHPHIREAKEEIVWLKKKLDKTFRAAHVWRLENEAMRIVLDEVVYNKGKK